MKSTLLATTLLVASATLAHAQAVTITGEARMGIQYDSAGFGGSNWRQEQRLDLDFNVAVQSDRGLSFGAWTRGRMHMGALGTATAGGFSPARVWVEANNFRLTFGNSDGALATYGYSHGWLGGCGVGYEYGIWCGDAAGLLAVAHIKTDTAVGGHPPQIMATYTADRFDVALSHRRGGSTELAVRARFGAVTVAAGHTTDGPGASTLSAHYNGGSWGVGAIASDVLGMTNWSVSGTAALGGGTAYAYVGREFGNRTYGLNYAYGLGGGATLMVGAERIGAQTLGSLGITVSF